MTPPQTGRLYLVGIGPGDPELITCKAVRILTQTSVWAAVRLVSESNNDHHREEMTRYHQEDNKRRPAAMTKIIFVLAMLLTVCAASAQAVTYYVDCDDPTARDADDQDATKEATPWKTLWYAGWEGEPNECDGGEDFLQLWPNGTWNDSGGPGGGKDTALPYICEWGGSASPRNPWLPAIYKLLLDGK